AGWNEFPAAHGFHCALIQPKTDALHDADFLRPSIPAYENRQCYRPLHLAVPRLVRVCRIGAIGASGRNESRSVRTPASAIAPRPNPTIASSIAILRPYAMSLPWAWRVRIFRHPGQSYSISGRKNRRGARIKNRRRFWQMRMLVLRKRGLHKHDRRVRRQISARRWDWVLVTAAASSARWVRAREAADEWCGKSVRAQRRCFTGERRFSHSLCIR